MLIIANLMMMMAEKNLEKVEAFNAYLDNQADDVAPYRYGIYMHNGDNPEPYASYDFFWMNYYQIMMMQNII